MAGRLKVLLVEPWMAGSHQRWAEGYAASTQHEVAIASLRGELWRWRLQGGAAPLAEQVPVAVNSLGGADVVFVSGLVDVAQFLGFTRRVLPTEAAIVVYQHESQLVYPTTAVVDRSAALANWASWLVADAVAFNSEYHRASVAEALPAFLAGLPDNSHARLLDSVLARFEVLPLGLDLSWASPGTPADASTPADADDRSTGPPVILWPHRWEADKDPVAFARALDRLDRAGLDYRLVLAGELPSPTVDGDDLRRAVAEARTAKVRAVGPFGLEEYRHHLRRADLVVSCARHDFFGAAVAEAVAAGALPVVPHGLAYPEVLGPSIGYEPGSFGTALETAVRQWPQGPGGTADLATRMQRYDWTEMAPRYDEYLSTVASRVRSRS